MNKTAILKITGWLLGPILIMVIGVYVLYPFLKPVEYNRVVEKFDREELPASIERFEIGRDFETLTEQVKLFRNKSKQLQAIIDSLRSVNVELTRKLKEEAKQDSMDRVNGAGELAGQKSSLQLASSDGGAATNEDLSEKVKGLLGLDEEDLSPIVNKLSDNQLFLLYREGNTLQRKKLLRSLESERAAQLMSRVIL